VNTHSFVSRSQGRWLRAGVALAVALGILAACNNDSSSSDFPVIVPVPNAVVIADVNGAPGLLVATTADEGLTHNPGFANVILNTPGSLGTFTKGTGLTYGTTGSDPSSIAVADLSGSGSLDMVIANWGSGSVSVFMHGSAPGIFMPAFDVRTGGAPNQVVSCDPHGAVVCDLTGNGKPSLILADMSNAGNAIVLVADPANPGQFLAPLKLPTGAFTPSAAVGDLNGDGAPDVVACGYDTAGNNGAVYVFLQDPKNRGTFLPPMSYPAGAQPQSVKIADVNGDGLPDLIVANLGPGQDGKGSAGVSVLLQDKSHPGTFLPPVTYTTPGGSIDVAVGSCPGASCSDLNGDNLPDLVLANLAPNPTGSISVLLQDPAHRGTFLAATNYPAFGQPLSVAIADLNGDGHRDIAAADGASAIVLFQNSASPGTFAQAEQVGF
jgi:hypothetical protein